MSRGCERIIGQRTPTKWCDDASARCNGSSQPDPRSASSVSMPPSTTHSIFNPTSSPGPRCGPSEPKRRRTGKMPSQHHEIPVCPRSTSARDRYRDKAVGTIIGFYMQTESPPDHPGLLPAKAFALLIEMACEQFEVLQLISTN